MYLARAVPHVVHLHGMLDGWAVQRSSWKKRLVEALYEGRHLRQAACIRALCDAEVGAIRQFGLQGRVCKIPNGVDLPVDRERGLPPWGRSVNGKKVLLMLSRIHPKKNIAALIVAWSHLHLKERPLTEEWDLVIAGWDTTGHQPELTKLVQELGVTSSVKWVGPLFGEQKDQAFRNADAFVLPSLSEGLPVAILEAWAYSLPAVMTPQCNLPDGYSADAAIEIGVDSGSIESGLRRVMTMTAEERSRMGARGRRLVKERYQWSAIARSMYEVNAWILGGGPVPACVE